MTSIETILRGVSLLAFKEGWENVKEAYKDDNLKLEDEGYGYWGSSIGRSRHWYNWTRIETGLTTPYPKSSTETPSIILECHSVLSEDFVKSCGLQADFESGLVRITSSDIEEYSSGKTSVVSDKTPQFDARVDVKSSDEKKIVCTPVFITVPFVLSMFARAKVYPLLNSCSLTIQPFEDEKLKFVRFTDHTRTENEDDLAKKRLYSHVKGMHELYNYIYGRIGANKNSFSSNSPSESRDRHYFFKRFEPIAKFYADSTKNDGKLTMPSTAVFLNIYQLFFKNIDDTTSCLRYFSDFKEDEQDLSNDYCNKVIGFSITLTKGDKKWAFITFTLGFNNMYIGSEKHGEMSDLFAYFLDKDTNTNQDEDKKPIIDTPKNNDTNKANGGKPELSSKPEPSSYSYSRVIFVENRKGSILGFCFLLILIFIFFRYFKYIAIFLGSLVILGIIINSLC